MPRKKSLSKIEAILKERAEHLRNHLYKELDTLSTRDSSVADHGEEAVHSSAGEVNSQIAAHEARELKEVEYALIKIREGTYGICEACKKEIPTERLEALPFCICCVKCQAEREKSGYSSHSEMPGQWDRVYDREEPPDTALGRKDPNN